MNYVVKIVDPDANRVFKFSVSRKLIDGFNYTDNHKINLILAEVPQLRE